MSVAASELFLTPPQVAKRYGVSEEKVIGWVRRGELRAINLAARRTGRPRWKIAFADLMAFESGRSAVPVQRASRPRRKRSDVIEYF